MKYIVLIFIFLYMGTGVALADLRGIGVTPAEIDIKGISSFPYSTEIFVKNGSATRESFEVTFKSDSLTNVSIEPSRFSLAANESKRVIVQFDEPGEKYAKGIIRVTAMRVSLEGFSTGTGLEIPVNISVARQVPELGIANIYSFFPSSWMVLFSIIGIFILLRALATFIYPLIFPVVKIMNKGFMEPGDTIIFDHE